MPMYLKTSRYIAIDTLHTLKKTRKPVSQIFAKAVSTLKLDSRDRQLAMNLVYGVLRQREYLDLLLGKLCRQPLKKLHPFVHQALAVGIYQIVFLHRIPHSAAVNETVNALKAGKVPKRLHGFVNGVLRECTRQIDTLPTPGLTNNEGRPILNHPSWMTTRWQKKYGTNRMYEICAKNNTIPPLTLRVNTLTTSRQDLIRQISAQTTTQPGLFAPNALILPDYHGPISDIIGYSEGYFQVQDEAAQLASLLLNPVKEGGSYLDGCAGLGGKTTHILELAGEHNLKLIAVEPDRGRQKKFDENMRRLHPDKKVTLRRESLQEFCLNPQFTNFFDAVLIDAPCSGTGVIGRNPDIRWNRSASDLPMYQKVQIELLNSTTRIVKPGGILVYATCSLEPEENEEVITNFLAHNTQFKLTDCGPFLPTSAQHLVKENFFSPSPAGSIDGFFAARLVREA